MTARSIIISTLVVVLGWPWGKQLGPFYPDTHIPTYTRTHAHNFVFINTRRISPEYSHEQQIIDKLSTYRCSALMRVRRAEDKSLHFRTLSLSVFCSKLTAIGFLFSMLRNVHIDYRTKPYECLYVGVYVNSLLHKRNRIQWTNFEIFVFICL